MLAPFSEAAAKLSLGTYEHYKGNRYEVLGVGRHTETLEELVIYRSLYGTNDLWLRPLTFFLETVDWEGKVLPRFKLIS
jgi:cyclomaltodextrinase